MVNKKDADNETPGKLERVFYFLSQRWSLLLWPLLFAWLLYLRWLIIRWSWDFALPAERNSFIAQQAFNGLVFTAVVVQALIYGGQLRVMGVSFKPRLRVMDVRAENLEAGKEPIFIVWIKNEGATDANGVRLHLRVSVGHPRPIDAPLAKKTGENVVTIHAGQEESYFVPWGGPITEEQLKEMNRKGGRVTVSGYYKPRWAPRKDFSYRYYPLENRPKGVPQFLPSDFDTGLTTVITTGAARLKLEPHPPDVITTDQTPNGIHSEALPPMQDDISIENAPAPQEKENKKIEGEQSNSDPN
ncbi:MAG TPA: hypothetical protein VGD61_07570 [Pyrinomonadaceae bacterium]